MTFRVPSVIVYQEFLTATPTITDPFFDLCIVGPCYQVLDEVECAPFVAAQAPYRAQYPGIRSDATLDKKFTQVKLSDIYVKVWPASSSATTTSSAVTIDDSGYDTASDVYTDNISAYTTAATQYTSALTAYNEALADFEEDDSEENEAAVATAKSLLDAKLAAKKAALELVAPAYDGLTRITGSTVAFSTEKPQIGDIIDVTYTIGTTSDPSRLASKTITAAIKYVSSDYTTIIPVKNMYSAANAYEGLFGDLEFVWDTPPTDEEQEAITVVATIRRATNTSATFAVIDNGDGDYTDSDIVPYVEWYKNVYTGEVKTSIADIEDPTEIMKWQANSGFQIKSDVSVATPATDGDLAFIAQANVKVSFRALRQDIANDFVTISSYADAKAQFGELNYNNPLSVAAYLVSQAMSDIRYKVLPISEDEDTGYISALDILSNDEDVYVIVPLSQSKNVIAAYANHCTSMSQPEKSMWRICYGSQPMPATKIICEQGTGKFVPGTAGTMYLKDNEGTFVSNIARAGDFVDTYEVDADGEIKRTYSYLVTSVVNESVAKLSTIKYVLTGTEYIETDAELTLEDFGTGSNPSINVVYEVTRALDVQGQADTISEIAKSFNNKRLRLVYPDTVLLNLNDVTYMVPSYYMCVTLGAMRAGYAPHQGFSTIGLSGISRIYHSNKYFTDDQLADMAGNGVFWVCQEAVEALPYVLYQTTTCTDSLEVGEDSCVATVDYASKYYKNNLKVVLGKYNVNTISLKYVTNIINACSDRMVNTKYEYIGSILTSANLLNIVGVADKIKPTIKIEIPYPVNGVDITLQV